MQTFIKRLNDLLTEIEVSFTKLKITEKQNEANNLTKELAQPEVWNNPTNAQLKTKKLSAINNSIEPWIFLRVQAKDLIDLIGLGDESLNDEFETQVTALEKEYKELKKDLLFNGEFDNHDAIIRLSAGVGGNDAQDWTEMLERMYLRWAKKSNFITKIIDRSVGEEAGIKSSIIEVGGGANVYGKLKSENGVHRLVRLSPFNSDNLRQTSFALVEILPKIDQPDEVKIDDKDLRIDVYRSGGKGGQSVNTTDSAVRITHTPTGLVVAIQNERSQTQNRETAMSILRSKLLQLKLETRANSIADLQAGESASWGSQIRNYVMHPYTLVKDTRTKYEETDVQAVLDGNIDGFIETYLEQFVSN